MKSPEPHENIWSLELSQVFEIFDTSASGLSADEGEQRKKIYGDNVFKEHARDGALKVFFEQFLSPLIWVLIAAGSMTWYLQEVVETIVIFGAVLINVLFAFYQEYKAEGTIEQLASYLKNRATVLRDGVLQDVDARMLVPGDIVSITYGNRIPADGRLIEVTDLRVDEAILTGESLPVEKKLNPVIHETVAERTNGVFCGTYVTQGTGLFVVTATSTSTEIGKIAESVSQAKRVKTPVQNAVRQISWYIFVVVLVIVVFIFILGISRGENIFDMMVLSAAVAVGAVPEALPITLTVILSVGVFAISKKGGLIRKLDAAETLGSTTLILTDKTGTLTEANLSLEAIHPASLLYSEQSIPDQIIQSLTDNQQQYLIKTLANIQVTVEKTGDDPQSWIYNGGAVDVVIMKSLHRFNVAHPKNPSGKLVFPFNSTNKYSVSVHGDTMMILGAPDVLVMASHGSDVQKTVALEHIKKLSEQGKRLVALGSKKIVGNDYNAEGVTLEALFVCADPIRADVPNALALIQSKGVAVKIITGDMVGTARNIAGRVGISVADHEFLTGDQIKNLDDGALIKMLPTIKLFARTTPADKLRIGNLYRSLGEVVAMTGDGVNDAPALKSMDIGISLGSGSDVAKSAADMVLLNNTFTTITETILEGYKIRTRIQKVFVYLMSNSLDQVFVIAGALIIGLPLPLTALQIIWVNMLTGTLPALAFSYDTNYHSPHGKKERKIFDFRTKFLALGIGTFSSLLLVFLYIYLTSSVGDIHTARTVFFACFATYVLAIAYSLRDLEKSIFQYNPFSNMRLNASLIVGFGLIIVTLAVPSIAAIFQTGVFPMEYLWIVIVWNIFNIGLVESAKVIMRYTLRHQRSSQMITS